jgi:DNA-binding NtrC family response regulator
MMLRYNWPGNIRELRNVIERIVIITPGDSITHDLLPENISDSKMQDDSINITVGTPLKKAEETIILRTLDAVDNNKSRAAALLGLSRKALYNKLERFNGQ